MAVKTIQEKVDEKLDRHAGVGSALHSQEKAAGKADGLEALYAAPAITKRARQHNQTNDKRPRRWQLLTSKKVRGKSSLFVVLLILFGGGGFMTIFMSPSLAIVQLRQVLTQDLNDQLKSFDTRSAMMLRTKLKDVTKGSCGAVKIHCRFGTVSNKQAEKFAKHGIIVDRDMSKSLLPNRGQATRFTFVDPETGAKTYITNAADLHRLTTNNVAARAQLTKAYNPVFTSLSDKVARASMRYLGTSKASKITGDTDEEREKSINTAVGQGEKIDPRTLTPEVDKDNKPTGRLIGPDGIALTEQQIREINESGAIAEQAGKVKPSQIVSSIGKAVLITGVVDSACTVANAIRMVGSMAKTKEAIQAARFANGALLIPSDKIMAGDGLEGEATFVGNKINNIGGPAQPDKIVDESKLDQPGSAANPPMIDNPDMYATAFDGPGPKASQYGDAPTLDSRAARFSLSGWFVGRLAKVNEAIALAITGGTNPDPQVISDRCKFIQNPYVRGTALVAGIFVGIGSFGLAQAAGIAGSLMFSMALPYVLSIAADIAAGDVFKDLYGKDFGDASFVGTSVFLGTIALRRGMPPLSAKEAVAYTQETQKTYEQYAEVQRYLARAEPFNIYNQHSFMGSVASAVAPVARQSGSSLSSMAMGITNLVPASFGSLTATAKAANPIERFEKCEDPVYRRLNIGADIFCNVRYGLSDQELAMDPLDNAQWMADTGNIDPNSETGEAKDNGQNWNYVKFLKECVNRTAGWGEDQEENQGDGNNCVKPENEAVNQHFRIYTMDKSVSDAMDGETGEGELPGTSGYNTGEKGAVAADGWAYPTVQDAYISPEGRFMEPGRGVHKGIDMITRDETKNKPIFAARNGVVIAAGPAQGFGNWIVISHNVDGKRMDTVYGHMEDDGLLVKLGDTVRAGQQIGRIGNKGDSSGHHLHFEIWEGSATNGGNAIDPAPIIKAKAER